MKINIKALLLSVLVLSNFNAKAVSGWKVAAGAGILAGGYLVYKLYDKYKCHIWPTKSNVVHYYGLSQVDTTGAGDILGLSVSGKCIKSGADIYQKTFFQPAQPALEIPEFKIKITQKTLNGIVTYQIEKYILDKMCFCSEVISDVNLPKLQNVLQAKLIGKQDGKYQLILIQNQYNFVDILNF